MTATALSHSTHLYCEPSLPGSSGPQPLLLLLLQAQYLQWYLAGDSDALAWRAGTESELSHFWGRLMGAGSAWAWGPGQCLLLLNAPLPGWLHFSADAVAQEPDLGMVQHLWGHIFNSPVVGRLSC